VLSIKTSIERKKPKPNFPRKATAVPSSPLKPVVLYIR